MDARSLAKSLYYRFDTPRLAGYEARLGYGFHTEHIYDARVFGLLVEFCRRYQSITGRRPICFVMTGVNARVRAGMAEHGVRDEEYAARVHRLGEHASLGYHGHFWVDPARHAGPHASMLHCTFVEEPLARQVAADMEWFAQAGIDHRGCYSAGWWFTNRALLRILSGHGFRRDFSVSTYPWFYNHFVRSLVRRHAIATGEPFAIRFESGESTVFIQDLIGCHDTRFPQDLSRVLTRTLSPSYRSIVGVVHSHDYNLTTDMDTTLRAVEYLRDACGVTFQGEAEFTTVQPSRVIPIAEV